MGVPTLLLGVALLAAAGADLGYDARLSPVELAIIKSVVDAVPGGAVAAGNPFDWTALQSRSRALQGADVQVVQVRDREPDFSGRGGRFPDDASIVRAVSSQLGAGQGGVLTLQGGAQGWNVLRSVSAELHLNAEHVPQQRGYNEHQPFSSLSGAHATGGGSSDFSVHRSISSEISSFQAAPQPPVAQGPREGHFFNQPLSMFNNNNNNNRQSFTSSGGHSSGGGFNDFSMQRSVENNVPWYLRPPPQGRVDGYNQPPSVGNYNQPGSGSQGAGGGLSEFSIQRSIASEIPSTMFADTPQHQSFPQQTEAQGGIEHYNHINNYQAGHHSGAGFGDFSIQPSISSNDFPPELFSPPSVAQQPVDSYNQPLPVDNNSQHTSSVSGGHTSGGGLSEFSIERSEGSEIPAVENQVDYSQSEGFVESGNVNDRTNEQPSSYENGANVASAGEIEHFGGSFAGNQPAFGNTNPGTRFQVEVDVRSIENNYNASPKTDEAPSSSGSEETSSETGSSAEVETSAEDNSVQHSSGEEPTRGYSEPVPLDDTVEHASRDQDDGNESRVHQPERVETPPLEDPLPCQEGHRRIKNECRKVYSLQLRAHVRRK